MMVRTIRVVTAAAAVSVGVAAQGQPLDTLGVTLSSVEGQQQPPPAVPSAAPTVQAGDTRPIHVYIRAGLKSHGEGAHDYPQFIADAGRRLVSRSQRAGARQHRRDGDVQGGRRLHDRI